MKLGVLAIANRDSDFIAFQKITPSQQLVNKTCLIHSRDTFIKNDKPGIILKEIVNCIYYREDLYFTSYHQAKAVFDLKQYYEEASEKAVSTFLESTLFEFENQTAFIASIDSLEVRRKIVLIEKTGVLKMDYNSIIQIANEKNIPLHTSPNNKIIIPADKEESRYVLGFLSDKLFRSNFTNELFLTNSVQKIPYDHQ